MVQAHTDGGYGIESHEVRHKSQGSVPSKPGKPVFMTSTSTSVTISWLPPKYLNGEPVKSYHISRQILLKDKTKRRRSRDEGTEAGDVGGEEKGQDGAEGEGDERKKEQEGTQWMTYMCGGSR